MTKAIHQQVFTSTVSVELLRDLLLALQKICDDIRLRTFLSEAGISPELAVRRHARITHEQLVRFYQIAATSTGDEMMGLWSRPIRTGALKVICRSVRDASSVGVALYRFTQVWNLMLDDYRLEMLPRDGPFGLQLVPRETQPAVNRFGHMLMLKLAHGVVSWLVAHEVPVRHVAFAFPRPDFAEDYRILFPAEVEYDAPCSTIHFDSELAEQRFERPYSDLRPFLERAPRDWIFTTYKEHTLSMKVRDFAIFELINTDKRLEDIAYDHGFASVSIFHRAFKRWTGNTPGEYRRTRLIVPHVIPRELQARSH